MAEAEKNQPNYQEAKRQIRYQFSKISVISGGSVDDYENQVQSLLKKGQRNRRANAAPVAKAGGGGKNGLNFYENGQIAKIVPFLDRPNVKSRKAFADWCESLKPANAAEGETNLIEPVKIDVKIKKDDFALTFKKDLSSCVKECKDCPALLGTFMRVVTGLMEKFYQKTHQNVQLQGRNVQLVISCKMINASEKGHLPFFKPEDDSVVISTNYLVSVGDSPALRIVFQDLHNINKSDITHDIKQDTFTIWHNDLYQYRIEAQGPGEAIFLCIGLVDLESVPQEKDVPQDVPEDLPVWEE